MAKSRDAFRTISEVSDWLDTPAHVLRFWESKFAQVKPVKRAGGRRYYRPQDMALLGGIKTLLHDQGMTIKGAQKLIREEGVKHVAALGPDPSGTGKPMVDVTPKPKKTKAKPAPAVEADPNDPWPADPAPVEDATKATPVETIADEPATKPKSTRTIPALPDEAAAQERPGIAAIALAANAGLAGKNSAAIRPLLARLKAVRDNATAA